MKSIKFNVYSILRKAICFWKCFSLETVLQASLDRVERVKSVPHALSVDIILLNLIKVVIAFDYILYDVYKLYGNVMNGAKGRKKNSMA